jgi:DDE superfamily endonuclease
LPALRAVPLSRFSVADVREEAIACGLVEQVSVSTVWRWLDEDALKPWRHRSWIFPRAPDFAAKAGVVLDLYQRQFVGERLGPDEFILSADEKTSIQARCRRHPTRPPAGATAMRVEHEYERGGALAYLAAWDVHRARLFGRCEATTGIAPFGRLVEQAMASEPYASAARVFWVVDNGSSHRGQASIDRLEGAWPNLRLVHLPVHASWLNQVEIYLSICQSKVLTPNDCADLGELQHRLLAFQRRYEQTAVPFAWRFTRADLERLLRRLSVAERCAATA